MSLAQHRRRARAAGPIIARTATTDASLLATGTAHASGNRPVRAGGTGGNLHLDRLAVYSHRP